LVKFTPKEGLQVLVRARVGLYEPRGEYQLIVEHMEEAGHGALQRKFEELKARLAAEGLFDVARKRAVPRIPRRIGVITSPTGAAIRDILHVLRRRFAAAAVLIYPVPVQGADAAAEIAAAIGLAGQRGDCDVLILARGGGSLEDLWSFNDEAVARAMAACPIPIICGVGHEVDVTIADFVADLRAPTPSAAAEMAVPDGAQWLQQLQAQAARLNESMRRVLAERRDELRRLAQRARLSSPRNRLAQQAQRLDEFEQRLGRAQLARLRIAQDRLRPLQRTLQAVSPLATLERGYAIVRKPDGSIVRDAAETPSGTQIIARLARGELHATVDPGSK
jgi:exodeoxyribonuclease VII large subunit